MAVQFHQLVPNTKIAMATTSPSSMGVYVITHYYNSYATFCNFDLSSFKCQEYMRKACSTSYYSILCTCKHPLKSAELKLCNTTHNVHVISHQMSSWQPLLHPPCEHGLIIVRPPVTSTSLTYHNSLFSGEYQTTLPHYSRCVV